MRVEGTGSFKLVTKLRMLKSLHKVWNKEVFGGVKKRKDKALRTVKNWDCVRESRSLFEYEITARAEAKNEYKQWALMVEITWR